MKCKRFSKHIQLALWIAQMLLVKFQAMLWSINEMWLSLVTRERPTILYQAHEYLLRKWHLKLLEHCQWEKPPPKDVPKACVRHTHTVIQKLCESPRRQTFHPGLWIWIRKPGCAHGHTALAMGLALTMSSSSWSLTIHHGKKGPLKSELQHYEVMEQSHINLTREC